MTTTRGVDENETVEGLVRLQLHKENQSLAKVAEAMVKICPTVQFIDAYAILEKISNEGVDSEPYEMLHNSVKNFFLMAKLQNSDYVAEFKNSKFEETREAIRRQEKYARDQLERMRREEEEEYWERERGRELVEIASNLVHEFSLKRDDRRFTDEEQLILSCMRDYFDTRLKYGGGIIRKPWVRWNDLEGAHAFLVEIKKCRRQYVEHFLQSGEKIW